MGYAPVYDYRWGCGVKQVTDRAILNDAKKVIIHNGSKMEINYIPKIGDYGIHGGVLQVMRGKRVITYH
jgi:hypothetical protein